MGRKSSIERAPPPVRQRIERFLRENRLTLDEMVAAIQTEFGADAAPSRSALHRFGRGFEEMMVEQRRIEAASQAMIGELGEGIGEKSGALLAQAVTTLATKVAFRAHAAGDDLGVDDLRKIAIAARNALDSRRMSLSERKAIEQETRERTLREQRQKLEALGQTGAIDLAALATVIKAAYDL